MTHTCVTWQKSVNRLTFWSNFVSRATVKNLDNTLAENKRLYKERAHYSLQLKDHLNAVREEAAIQVIKTKDFSECQKLKYTENIQKLEQKLAESRASACLEFEKRDCVSTHIYIYVPFWNINGKCTASSHLQKLLIPRHHSFVTIFYS